MAGNGPHGNTEAPNTTITISFVARNTTHAQESVRTWLFSRPTLPFPTLLALGLLHEWSPVTSRRTTLQFPWAENMSPLGRARTVRPASLAPREKWSTQRDSNERHPDPTSSHISRDNLTRVRLNQPLFPSKRREAGHGSHQGRIVKSHLREPKKTFN